MKARTGFTVIELLIVIVIITILVTIMVFGFGSWRKWTATTEVKAALIAASSGIRSKVMFGAGYDPTYGMNYAPPNNVSLTFSIPTDGLSYCINATSTIDSSVIYSITSASPDTPVVGTCS